MNDKYSRTKEDATDVVIGGKVYRLTGADGAYLQEVASFLNRKLSEVRTANGYNHMDDAYRALLLDLNLADEYFKEKKETESCRVKAEELEREVYSLKYELAATKMKLETALRQQAVIEERTEGWKKRYEELLNAQADLWKTESEQTVRSSKPSAGGVYPKKKSADAADTKDIDDGNPGAALSVQEWDADRFDTSASPETKAETEAASGPFAARENTSVPGAAKVREPEALTPSLEREPDVLIASEQEVQETDTQADEETIEEDEDAAKTAAEQSRNRENDARELVENLRYGNALRAATRIDELHRSGAESYTRRDRVVILPETERKKPRRRIIPEA